MTGSRNNKWAMCTVGVLAAVLLTAPRALAAAEKETKKAPTFLVTVDGMPGASGRFEVSDLSVEVQVIEYRDGGDTGIVRKRPGRASYPFVKLKRGMTTNEAFWRWMQRSAAGVHDPRKVTIDVYSADGVVIQTYQLHNAWPCKWYVPDVDTAEGEVAIEAITLAHEGLTRVE